MLGGEEREMAEKKEEEQGMRGVRFLSPRSQQVRCLWLPHCEVQSFGLVVAPG